MCERAIASMQLPISYVNLTLHYLIISCQVVVLHPAVLLLQVNNYINTDQSIELNQTDRLSTSTTIALLQNNRENIRFLTLIFPDTTSHRHYMSHEMHFQNKSLIITSYMFNKFSWYNNRMMFCFALEQSCVLCANMYALNVQRYTYILTYKIDLTCVRTIYSSCIRRIPL